MGWFSWLFPMTEADRIAKARALLDRGRFAEARLEVVDLTSDAAQVVCTEAEQKLALMNLEQAVGLALSGDDERSREHLTLARRFTDGSQEEQFSQAHQTIQEARDTREAEVEARRQAVEARLFDIHPDFAHDEHLEMPLPEGVTGEQAEELKARLALVLDNYPAELRSSMLTLGPSFARAVLDLEEGNIEASLQALIALPDEAPLVLYERARAAHALGDPRAAARALRAFEEHAGAHHAIGRNHTGVMLAQMLAESRELEEALATLRRLRVKDPDLGGILYAQLLEATQNLPEAERVISALIRKHPSETPLYTLLARVRAAGGHRVQAMQVLEKGLAANHCTPGRCGYKAPDLAAHRTLAILYLEDAVERDRALELADIAASLVTKPTWEDEYLRALAARETGDQEAPMIAERLLSQTPPPLRERASRYLATA